MGKHGEVHAAPGGEAEAGHGVDSLVAPDPEPAPAPELAPPTPGLSDQVEAGDGDQAGHQQLGQPEVGSGAVMDVEPARHVQVRPAIQKKDKGWFGQICKSPPNIGFREFCLMPVAKNVKLTFNWSKSRDEKLQ